MLIKVKIETSARKQKIESSGKDHYTISVKALPKNNQANKEILILLKERFNRKARIIKGRRSKNKIIELI